MFSALALALSFASTPAAEINPLWAQALEQLLETLRREELWQEPTRSEAGENSSEGVAPWIRRKQELSLALKQCGELRTVAAVPILVRHIDYDGTAPYGPLRPTSLAHQYPSVAVLVKIGTPAVPALLDVVKKTDVPAPQQLPPAKDMDDEFRRLAKQAENARAREDTERPGLRRHLALECLREIYNDLGPGSPEFGIALLRARIALEMKHSNDHEKRNLEHALGSLEQRQSK